MKIDKLYFKDQVWHIDDAGECDKSKVNIVFVFGDIDVVKSYKHSDLLKEIYPNAHIVGTSTSGNIIDDHVSEYGAVATAISFDNGSVDINTIFPSDDKLLEDAKSLVKGLKQDGLKHIFVLSKGLGINGSELVRGMNEYSDVSITGGLAGDGNVYKETFLFANDVAQENLVVAIGFYGDSLNFEVGCKAGWEEFGAKRTITSSYGNVIKEIDSKPALELYKKYLGEYIKELPASGLLFPLSIQMDKESTNEVVRVMMGINEDGSIIFAGDVPQGASVRLMKTNIDNLIDGSEIVANSIKRYNDKRSLALTVSCTGRLSVLRQLADEEIEVVQNVLGNNTQVVGFYSYGEIAPFSNDLLNCQLHNQTMTVTTIYED